MKEKKYISLLRTLNISIDEIMQEFRELATVIDLMLPVEEDSECDDALIHISRSIRQYSTELADLTEVIEESGALGEGGE